jgi:hypothetical protein
MIFNHFGAAVWSSATAIATVPLVEPLVTRDASGSTYLLSSAVSGPS